MHRHEPLVIDCDTCAMRATDACDDCVMSFLCDGPAAVGGIVLDLEEQRRLRMLAAAGLVPTLRHRVAG